MIRQPVQSSNIAAVGYDPATAELEIEFAAGGLYRYADVPADKYQQLIAAESVGSHFAANIKGRFAHRRIFNGRPA